MDRLLKIEQVLDIVCLGRATVYEKMNEGTFPRQRKIGKRAVAWKESDIKCWLDNPETYNNAAA